jgi:hypothetical protein
VAQLGQVDEADGGKDDEGAQGGPTSTGLEEGISVLRQVEEAHQAAL